MTKELRQCLEQWAFYMKETKNGSLSVENRLKFIENDTIPFFFHAMSIVCRRLDELEHKPRSEFSTPLWLPTSYRVNG